jgi:hypothetical protein
MRESPGSKTIPHWSPRAACARTLRKQRAATSRFLCHVKFFLHFFQNFLRRRNVFGIRRRSRVSKLQFLEEPAPERNEGSLNGMASGRARPDGNPVTDARLEHGGII